MKFEKLDNRTACATLESKSNDPIHTIVSCCSIGELMLIFKSSSMCQIRD